MNELVKRVIVAFIGIPLAIFIIYMGGWIFFAAVILFSAFALWEFYRIAEKKNSFPNKIPGIIMGVLMMILFYYRSFLHDLIWLLISNVLFVMIIFFLELIRKKPNGLLNISTTIGGILYVIFPFSCLIGIREFYSLVSNYQIIGESIGFEPKMYYEALSGSAGCGWFVVNVFITVWIGDSAAYFIGKKWGKHKLFPRISPKKTWEGAIAGFVFSIIALVVTSNFLTPRFPLKHALIIGSIIGVIGQIGDLAESLLKRDAGIKDSSGILPGHGGVLDRFDSILFVAPTVYIYLLLIPYLF